MDEFSIVGIDRAQHVFQVHRAAADGRVLFRKKLSRPQFAKFKAAVGQRLRFAEIELEVEIARPSDNPPSSVAVTTTPNVPGTRNRHSASDPRAEQRATGLSSSLVPPTDQA